MRKFLALLSLILTITAVSSVASAAKFTDVPASDETLTKAVDLLSSVGITTGTTETTFGTSEGVTRQQMATFIYRLMKAGKTVEGGDNTTTFTDLDDPFYYFMISWANDTGIIKGRNATTFDPKGGIILQDAYVMIVRALGYEKEESLVYPFDYIKIAEDIGLDEGLPANVNYDTALTRGNVAILLYNAFYADMATGETAYDVEYEEVELTSGKLAIVEKGQTPYTIYDTVAEKIFGVKKTVQRVVATPNYCIDENDKTDDDKNDVEIVALECFDKDYIETDADLFGDVEFESLGLSGNADDYFLIDLSIYYKKEENKEPEIISASALGTRTKEVASSKVKFERESGTARQNYMLTSYNQSREQRYKKFTGKVTVDGVSSYLFNAPWSYSKPANIEDKDDECITLIWLDASERDPEDEEYVPDFNFKSDRDVIGRGAEYYSSLSRTTYYDSGKTESYTLGDEDLRGVGLYTSWGFNRSTILDLGMTPGFEVDVWDSNGDGKLDYMWFKPYTMGQAVIDEAEPTFEMHNSSDPFDNYGPVYEACEVPKIYTYGANTTGATFKEDQVIVGYLNGPANYLKVVSVADLKYETHTFTSVSSRDGSSIGLDGGSNSGKWGASLKYVGFPLGSGERPDTSSLETSQLNSAAPFVSKYFNHNKNLGKEFAIAYVSGLMLHVKPVSTVLGDGANYAMIFPNTRGAYAYTTSVGVVTDGNLQKSGNMLEVLIDGELVDVTVKPQTSSKVAENNILYNEKDQAYTDGNGNPLSAMPVTKKQPNGTYDFSDYVGKLLTFTVNSEDEYVFKIAPLDGNKDDSVLSGDDDEAYYTYESDLEGKVTSAFVNTSSNLYQFVKVDDTALQTQVAPSKYVSFTDNTMVVIKTYDEDDEPVFTMYDSENMPNFDNSDEFKNIKYIVKNNPKSTTIEELIYLYAESTDGDTSVKIGNTLDFRFVKATKAVKEDDTRIIYYDVYNPFEGTVEEEYEAVSDSETVACEIGGIYSLSGGYIADENLLGHIDDFGAIATSETTKRTEDLGLVAIAEFDKESGLLAIEGEDLLFQVDEDTVVTFLDLDEETIELKSADILSSTSKAYRCNDSKEMPLLAFVASSEVKKEDEFEHAEIICIVRYDELEAHYGK